MLRFAATIVFILFSGWLHAQVTSEPKEAFQWVSASGKPLLLVFQGSDWCLPCIRLERKVLHTDSFVQYARENIVVLKADFPQKKKIVPSLAKRYEELAAIYNKEGRFPKLVLLDPAQQEIKTLGTDYANTQEIIDDIDLALKRYHEKM